MALDTRLSNVSANAEADAFGTLFNGGFLRIYSGSMPLTADHEVTDQVLLAELGFEDPTFNPAINGTLTTNYLEPETSALATGEASWFRCIKSDGVTKIMDGTIGLSGCNLNMNSLSIQQGSEVSIGTFQHTVVKSG